MPPDSDAQLLLQPCDLDLPYHLLHPLAPATALEPFLTGLCSRNVHTAATALSAVCAVLQIRADTGVATAVLETALNLLQTPLSHARQRCGALRAAAVAALVLQQSSATTGRERVGAEVAALLVRFIGDPDARVRAEALGALLRQLGGGAPEVELAAAAPVLAALQDSASAVRLRALLAVSRLAQLHPDQAVQPGGLRLADTAFEALCHAVHDGSAAVRAAATTLVGRIPGTIVAPTSVLRLLSREVIKHGRVLQALDRVPRSEPAGGAVQARPAKRARLDDATTAAAASTSEAGEGGAAGEAQPEGDADVQFADAAVLVSGSTGALVHALEDDDQAVRLAGVAAAQWHARDNVPFAERAVEFVVDMLGDDADAVRVAALAALEARGASLTLAADHTATLLALLDDRTAALRIGSLRLLASARVQSATQLSSVVAALQRHAAAMPGERSAVLSALACLGAHHAAFVGLLLPELLHTQHQVLAAEQRVEDPRHVCALALVANAMASEPSLAACVPRYVARHCASVRLRYPTAFPRLAVRDAGGAVWSVAVVQAAECVAAKQSGTSLFHTVELDAGQTRAVAALGATAQCGLQRRGAAAAILMQRAEHALPAHESGWAAFAARYGQIAALVGAAAALQGAEPLEQSSAAALAHSIEIMECCFTGHSEAGAQCIELLRTAASSAGQTPAVVTRQQVPALEAFKVPPTLRRREAAVEVMPAGTSAEQPAAGAVAQLPVAVAIVAELRFLGLHRPAQDVIVAIECRGGTWRKQVQLAQSSIVPGAPFVQTARAVLQVPTAISELGCAEGAACIVVMVGISGSRGSFLPLGSAQVWVAAR
eukprot:TRINITY_DN11850_c0_g1_i1.p1 TRINITY_DN11850_c0_g1~~TRINITY_DN11850_c0_g1_i1.p1  ORF type:complete len:834 (-),score=202.02 TRINITY_DN11850_c0_g1_i1:28-2529(-)